MDTDIILSSTGLTKRYGDRLAVDAVDLTVRRGEVYGFLGPNGAGKTTTLRMALGLVRPTSGTVSVLGRPAGSPDIVHRVGALVEGPGFYPMLSGRDNLRVMARYRGLPDSAADAALERVDLAGRGGDAFRSYSLGMKQRLGVASALMGEPDLIVLDEPTNGLDPAGMADMRALVRALAGAGHTIVLSSHLMAEVEDVCDRVGVIASGRLVRESSVEGLVGDRRLRVRTSRPEVASEIARRLAGSAATLSGDEVIVPGPSTDLAPELVRELVAAGVDVLEVTAVTRSLEEVYFEVTTGAPAAA